MEMDELWLADATGDLSPGCQVTRRRHRFDEIFVIMMGTRIIAIKSGFGMMESAYARGYNAANVMMKSLNDVLWCVLTFYLFGAHIALERYQGPGDDKNDFAEWFAHYCYVVTSVSIISGALVGRCSIIPYLVLCIFFTGIVYPVAVRWAWEDRGFLRRLGFHDFAGSCVVHVLGATSALMSVCVCGPRIGRFAAYRSWRGLWRIAFLERYQDSYYHAPQSTVESAVFQVVAEVHSPVQLLFGVFLLFVGFLALNPTAVHFQVEDSRHEDVLASRVTFATMLMATAGSLAPFAAAILRTCSTSVAVPDFSCALLGSMVSSCACCDVLPHVWCFVVGFVGGLLAIGMKSTLACWMIDDPAAAIAAHGIPGVWGVISVALFAKPNCHSSLRGIVYGGGGKALELLATQLLGLLVLVAWAAVVTYCAVVLLDLAIGIRCNRASELLGLDFTEHHVDEGAHQEDPRTRLVLQHTPVRTTLATTLSPRKIYQMHRQATEDELNEAADRFVARFDREDVQEEVASLRREVRLLMEQLSHNRAAASTEISALQAQLMALSPHQPTEVDVDGPLEPY